MEPQFPGQHRRERLPIHTRKPRDDLRHQRGGPQLQGLFRRTREGPVRYVLRRPDLGLQRTAEYTPATDGFGLHDRRGGDLRHLGRILDGPGGFGEPGRPRRGTLHGACTQLSAGTRDGAFAQGQHTDCPQQAHLRHDGAEREDRRQDCRMGTPRLGELQPAARCGQTPRGREPAFGLQGHHDTPFGLRAGHLRMGCLGRTFPAARWRSPELLDLQRGTPRVATRLASLHVRQRPQQAGTHRSRPLLPVALLQGVSPELHRRGRQPDGGDEQGHTFAAFVAGHPGLGPHVQGLRAPVQVHRRGLLQGHLELHPLYGG